MNTLTVTERITRGLKAHPDWTDRRLSKSYDVASSAVAALRAKLGIAQPDGLIGAEPSSANDALKQTVLALRREIALLTKKRDDRVIEIGKKAPPYRFGVLACTHYASKSEQLAVTRACYDWFKQEGIKDAYHCGDMTEGCQMRKGHENEIKYHGADAQIEHVVKEYPYVKGITTYLISGNHDASHIKNGGIDVCEHIAEHREDIIYLGMDYGRFKVKRPGEKDITIDLMHPDGGSAISISLRAQQIIDGWDGPKPDVLLIGHYHKAMTLPAYKGVAAVLAGCTQGRTGFMRRRNLAAHVGCHIIEVRNLDGSVVVSSCWRSWFPSAV